ncbi:unnamed protein product [Didymodactylos carnosus]|uniref:Uncharacterized protein n=1 Tax=Didymodactylos carnosus TaxID=1234261 RepID=A0A815DH42_9BILA|nr:unnamed protein product [Didymodactylos carnosus]CAF4113303.1 unnamed protein product [Didymodactylos carnosus]
MLALSGFSAGLIARGVSKEILEDSQGPMNQFHKENTSSSDVVEINCNFSGTTVNEKTWQIQFSIYARVPWEYRDTPRHYGGRMEWTYVDGNTRKCSVAQVWVEEKVSWGLPTERQYEPEEYSSGNKEKIFDDGGRAEWKCTSTRHPH